ncbi:hypothetical protein NMY22_g6596 [Coprinellus aureogranulatus]|nr:hypothetical protein NMY22_g6596 [Coprinellus aureogranulatus]
MAPRSILSRNSLLSWHSGSSWSLASYQPSIYRIFGDATSSVPASRQPIRSIEELPEELLLCILSRLEGISLLACASTSRTMNRLAIECLLATHGITDASSGHCRVVLTDGAGQHPDPLTTLLHSVHIYNIQYLDIRYMSYFSSHSLVNPLRRTLRLLRRLSRVTSMTLHFPSHFGGDDGTTHEKALRRTVLLFEDVLNEIILKSCKRLYLHGSRNLLENMYQFRGDDSRYSRPTTFLHYLAGARDYFSRRKEQRNEDPIIRDDLRYSRTTLTGSRVIARCSPAALSRTRLSHINMNTVDFLRPPLSQWLLTMLRASPIKSMSFDLHTSPRLPAGSQEYDFMLDRLAAVLPHLQSVHISGLKESVLPIFAKLINNFPGLTAITVEAPKHGSRSFSPFTPAPPSGDTAVNHSAAPCTFASSLRHAEGPVNFITWLFKDAYSQPPPRFNCIGGGISDIRRRENPQFPCLNKVHIDFYCVRGVKFDLGVLANAVNAVQDAQKHLSVDSHSARGNRLTIEVHLKFDKKFRGLRLSWSRGDRGIARLPTLPPNTTRTSMIDEALAETHPLPPDQDHQTQGASQVDPQLEALFAVGKVFLVLPGSRDEILGGKFNPRILAVITIFSGLRYLKLVSTPHSIDHPVSLTGAHFELFKGRNVNVRRIEVVVHGLLFSGLLFELDFGLTYHGSITWIDLDLEYVSRVTQLFADCHALLSLKVPNHDMGPISFFILAPSSPLVTRSSLCNMGTEWPCAEIPFLLWLRSHIPLSLIFDDFNSFSIEVYGRFRTFAEVGDLTQSLLYTHYNLKGIDISIELMGGELFENISKHTLKSLAVRRLG